MRAIVKDKQRGGTRYKRGTANQNTFKLAKYCCSPKASDPDNPERLLHSFGIGLDGVKLSDPAAVADHLERRVKYLNKGKMHRHILFSVVGEESQQEAIKALEQLARDWNAEFAAGSKAAGYIHGDGGKLHLHLVAEVYDPKTYKRYDWNDSDLSKWQDMKYTKAVTPGKGHKLTEEEKAKYASKQTEHSKNVNSSKRKRVSKDTALGNELVAWARGRKEPPASESGLLALLQHELPSGWTLKDKRKDGEPLARPSVSNGDTTVRLTRLWGWLQNKRKTKTRAKDKCPTCGKASCQCSPN